MMRKYGAAFLDGFCETFPVAMLWAAVIALVLWAFIA